MGRRSRRWIQEAIKRPGTLRRWMKQKYGSKAFTKEGTIKKEYLIKAREHVKRHYTGMQRKRMLGKINLALTLRKFRRR